MPSKKFVEGIVAATNQSHANVLAMLAELDVQIETGLKAGRSVPIGTLHVCKDACAGLTALT